MISINLNKVAFEEIINIYQRSIDVTKIVLLQTEEEVDIKSNT